jgi:hypothetical protein
MPGVSGGNPSHAAMPREVQGIAFRLDGLGQIEDLAVDP